MNELAESLWELRRRWKIAGLDVCAGVGANAIASFTRDHGIALPDDMATYFQCVDGMNEGETDPSWIRFWQLQELRPLPPPGGTPSSLSIVFADYSIEAHSDAVRVDGGRCDVVLVGGDIELPIAGCFGDFLALYLHRPSSLFHVR